MIGVTVLKELMITVVMKVIKSYSKEEIKDIALAIHAAKQEASDEGTKMTAEEALEIIDEIIIAYLED